MADYTQGTNFAAKDSLLTGNPSKLVRGTEINNELNAISIAIASKANTNSPAFTGTPTATAPIAAGTNTSQLATTAFVTTGFPSTNITFSGDNSYTGMQTFRDNKFEVVDNTDNTKKVALEVSGVTTGTTRTLTVPNKDGTIAVTSDLAAVSALSATSNTIVTGSYSATSSATITITTPIANTFAVGQEVFIAFSKTAGIDTLVANKFTIASIVSSTQFTINYGSTVTSSGDVTVERYGLMAVANAAEMTAGTSQLKAVTPKQFRDFSLVSGTSVDTTSGTTATFSNIPAWVKRITVIFDSVSTNGSNDILVRLGTSGGILSTGYTSTGGVAVSGNNTLLGSDSSGFLILLGDSGRDFSGIMTICLISGTKFVSSHSGKSGTARVNSGGGSVNLSGVLTQLQVALTGGNTFDAGSINVMYE